MSGSFDEAVRIWDIRKGTIENASQESPVKTKGKKKALMVVTVNFTAFRLGQL